MYAWRGIAVLYCSIFTGVAGCTTVSTVSDQKWVQDAKAASVKAADAAADSAMRTVKRMQRYLAEQDVLKTFHDAGEHSETAILDVLHKSKPHTARSGAPATSPVTPQKGQHPSTSPSLPQQFNGNLRWPVEAGIISSKFGERWGKPHKGIDIAADSGEPVYAIADAEVIYASDGLRGYGNVVILRHDQQMTSVYAHNSELKVHQGEHVAQGALISLLGNTGHSTGPHVHFEIREGDTAVDPLTMLPKSRIAQATHERENLALAQLSSPILP